VRDDVPAALAAVITRCLEKLPEHRPQTANALLDELDGVSTPHGGTGASGAVTAKIPAGRPARAGQRRALLAGALLVVAGGAAVALCTWRRSGGASAVTSVAATSVAAASAPASAVAPTIGTGTGRTLADLARAPIVLTPAESLAIADAIRKRVTARRDSQVAKGERAFADSLSRRFEQTLSDSLTRIMGALRGDRRLEIRGFDPKEIEKFRELAKMAAAMPNVAAPNVTAPNVPTQIYRVPPAPAEVPPVPPPAAGVRRVLLGAARNSALRRDLAGAAAAISDSLRRAIGARSGYEVVDAATLTDPRFYASRTRMSLARAVGAGAVLTGVYFPRPDSSVVLQLQLFDVQRNRVMRVLESRPIDMRDPMGGVADLVSATLAALDQVDWRPVGADSAGIRKPD
jgi:hypothetical protein